MAGRTRTTKKLAQRIQLDYFKRTFPIPFWRRAFSLGLTGVGLLWLGWDALASKQAYNAGPLSHGHKIVTGTCESCHALPSFWGTKTGDVACLKCHDAPVHQAKQTFTPECTSCHVDHQGSFKLSATTDTSCTQCHSDLKVKDGKTNFATSIKSLASGHPEFAAMRQGHPVDPGTIKLNHQIHLKKDLRGPDGKPVQMVCSDCHQQAMPPNPPNLKTLSPEMAPVTFEKHCMSCHPLVFDKRFKETVPHKETKIVEDYVIKIYSDYIPLHPNEVHEPVPI